MESGTDEASSTAATPSLTLVIPAYNESARISHTLSAVAVYLTGQPYVSDVIVVDDGSTDHTAMLATDFARQHRRFSVITIPHGGKAAALRAGMTAATGDLVGFSDADLATPIAHLDDLRRRLADGCDVAIGSREEIGARRIAEPRYRHLMGRVFNVLVRWLLLPGIQDTQCGFKLFRRQQLTTILRRSRLYSGGEHAPRGPRVTAFDVEMLVVACHLGYLICEVPVVWTYGDQSQVRPAHDTWHNLMDVARIRLNVWRGCYR